MKWNIKKLEKEIAGKRAGNYAPMYIYGTEMISYYYPCMNIKNKGVLTIAGSGDQIINAYFFGAREVIGFDINKLVGYMVSLKIAAIKSLSYNDFLKFFGTGKNIASFDYELYLKFRLKLDKPTKIFFDSLYKYFKFKGKKLTKSTFINQREYIQASPKDINIYLKNNTNYIKTRALITNKKIKIIHSNVTKINYKIKKKFDIINLSNVPNFLTGYVFKNRKDPIIDVYEKVFLKLKNLLVPKGKILFYLYSPQNYPNIFATTMPPLTTIKGLNKVKENTKFKLKEFSFKGINIGKDKIISLQIAKK